MMFNFSDDFPAIDSYADKVTAAEQWVKETEQKAESPLHALAAHVVVGLARAVWISIPSAQPPAVWFVGWEANLSARRHRAFILWHSHWQKWPSNPSAIGMYTGSSALEAAIALALSMDEAVARVRLRACGEADFLALSVNDERFVLWRDATLKIISEEKKPWLPLQSVEEIYREHELTKRKIESELREALALESSKANSNAGSQADYESLHTDLDQLEHLTVNTYTAFATILKGIETDDRPLAAQGLKSVGHSHNERLALLMTGKLLSYVGFATPGEDLREAPVPAGRWGNRASYTEAVLDVRECLRVMLRGNCGLANAPYEEDVTCDQLAQHWQALRAFFLANPTPEQWAWQRYLRVADEVKLEMRAAHQRISGKHHAAVNQAPSHAATLFGEVSDETVEPKTGRDARHSDDYRSVLWSGQSHLFTAAQAACVACLWRNWENGTPAVGEQTILESAGSSSERLRDLFDRGNHTAWGEMIVPVGKGAYRLAEKT